MALRGESGELITVVQLIRHGSRDPITIFKNTLRTNNSDNLKEGGDLTKEGKQEIYNLGAATRKKYRSILGPKYSKKHFKISSTGSDRTLMSAQLFSAGLYPPTPEDSWNDSINWQPIPVYEVPQNVLVFSPHLHMVSRYRNELREDEAEIVERLKETGLVDNVVKNIGVVFPADATLQVLVMLTDTLMVAEASGIEIQPWVSKMYPDTLMKIYEEFVRMVTKTPFRQMMCMGGFYHEIVEHMETKITNRSTGPNLLVYFGHDTNVVAVLEALKIKNYEWPKYGGALTFELWKKREEYVVKIVFTLSASTVEEPVVMKLPGDVTECEFYNFKNILKEFMLSREDFLTKYFK